MPEAIVPLMPESVIAAAGKNIQATGAPGSHSGIGGQGAAEVFPIVPGAIKPAMQQTIIDAAHKEIEALGAPGHGHGIEGQRADEPLPGMPAPIEMAMPERIIRGPNKEVELTHAPGGQCRSAINAHNEGLGGSLGLRRGASGTPGWRRRWFGL